MDKVADSSRSVRLLTSLGGDYGVEYAVGGSGKFYGRIEIRDEAKRLSQSFGGGNEGFVRLPEKLGNQGDWGVQIHGFAAEGRPNFLSTEHLVMRVTEYDDQAWFVWEFQDRTSRYYFQRMDSITSEAGTSWMPAGFGLRGTDFEFVTSVEKKIGSHSEYDILTAPQRCG